METPQQRERRVRQLEERRSERRSATPVAAGGVAAADGPVEVAPGRGDLTRTSATFDPSMFPVSLELGGASLLLVDGQQVSYARLFATQPWVAAAVMRMLTWAVRVPLKVYRRTGEDSRERLRAADHPLAASIDSPWDGGYPAALTMALLGPMLVHGNSITEVEEGRSGAIRFNARDWRYLTPIKPFRDVISGWKVAADPGDGGGPGRQELPLSADQVLHAAWWSPLGPVGTSPLQQLGTTLAIEDAAQRYQRAQFRRGARPPSAITASEQFLTLDRDTRDLLLAQLREDVTALYAGPENAGRPALLPPGLDWKPVGHTAVEAELIDQRYVAREEVAGVYQIPPPALGDLRRATYSNITELRQVAYTDGLGPPLVIIEQVITAQLIRRLLREDDVYVEYDFGGVLRGDLLKEINALRAAIGSALLTPNEGRAVLNRPRSTAPAMDDFFLPFNNLAPIGTPPARKQQQPAPPRGAVELPEHLGRALAQRRTRAPREIPTERKAWPDAEHVA